MPQNMNVNTTCTHHFYPNHTFLYLYGVPTTLWYVYTHIYICYIYSKDLVDYYEQKIMSTVLM